jgi:Fructose-bisphosphate aldolase class-I
MVPDPCHQGAHGRYRLAHSIQVEANAQQLAQYAATCQAAGLVPIVEPEILIEGSHNIATAAAVSARVISRCVAHLWQQVALMRVRSLPTCCACSTASDCAAGAQPLHCGPAATSRLMFAERSACQCSRLRRGYMHFARAESLLATSLITVPACARIAHVVKVVAQCS